jgi:hypothetical protein
MSYRQGCPDCAEHFMGGNGQCGKCNGTGINTQLDSAQSKCPYCRGSGLCATCNGTGFLAPNGDDIITLDLE